MQLGRKPQSPLEAESEDSDSPSVDTSAAAWDGQERRAQTDRRREPTRPWSGLASFFAAPLRPPLRRSAGRRAADHSVYVDRYTRQDLALLLTIFLLNVADAFMTLLWLGRGGREANPVMDFLLDIGPWAFLAQKCLVVGLWLVILVVHKNFRLARIGLYSALAVYGLLLIVHFGILLLGIEPPRREASDAAEAARMEQSIGPPSAQTMSPLDARESRVSALDAVFRGIDARSASE